MTNPLQVPYKPVISSIDDRDIATVERSEWFDAGWYLAKYPDVALSGLSPAQHYLALGEGWERAAGPRFNGSFYRKLYADIEKSGISPLLHFIRHGQKEGRIPVELYAQLLELRLWQQGAGEGENEIEIERNYILDELNTLLVSRDDWEASYAAWALGRWYAWRGDWLACANSLVERHFLYEQKPTTPAPWLLEIDALMKIGDLVAAGQRIQRLKVDTPEYPDTWLAEANLLAFEGGDGAAGKGVSAVADSEHSHCLGRGLNAQMRLKPINALLVSANVQPLALKQPGEPLTLDNLTGDVSRPSPRPPENIGLVSVIMPLFNAADYLLTALQSLREQSYPFFEVLIVDDASTDGSLIIAREFCQQDERFRVIPQPSNQGAYSARNRGLSLASGDFITVHDSDDWSHPEKLEHQVMGLCQNPQWKACFSDWVRCTTDMVFNRWRIETNDGWIYRNTSSFMFRREVFAVLGYWDRVKVEGDSEYFKRLVAAFGSRAFGEIKKGCPLAFGRALPSSLSQAGATHLVTQFNGVRRDYREAAARWHASARAPGDQFMPYAPHQRPFEAPAANLPCE